MSNIRVLDDPSNLKAVETFNRLSQQYRAEQKERKRLGFVDALFCKPLTGENLKSLQAYQCRYCRYWKRPSSNPTKKHVCFNQFSEYFELFCKPRHGCEDFIDRRPAGKGGST